MKQDKTFFRPRWSARNPKTSWPMTVPDEVEILMAVSCELESLPAAGK
jgi:hypothetical protein